MSSLDMEHAAPADPDFERLREFYAGMVEKLDTPGSRRSSRGRE